METCPIVRISEFCPCYLATTTPYWTHHTSFTTPPVGGGLFSTTYFCDDLKIQSLPVAITTPTKPYQSTELTESLQIDAFATILGAQPENTADKADEVSSKKILLKNILHFGNFQVNKNIQLGVNQSITELVTHLHDHVDITMYEDMHEDITK